MKLKTLHPRKLRYWTVQKGKLGTAHTNRDGKEVDFTPLNFIQGSIEKIDNKTFFIPYVPHEFFGYKELHQVPLEFVPVKTEAKWNDYLPYETITQIKIVIGKNESEPVPFPFSFTGNGLDKSIVITEKSRKLHKQKEAGLKTEPKRKQAHKSPNTEKVNKQFSQVISSASKHWKAKEWRWVRRHIQLGNDKAYDQLYELLVNLDASLFTQLNKAEVFKDKKGNPSFKDWLIDVLDIEI